MPTSDHPCKTKFHQNNPLEDVNNINLRKKMNFICLIMSAMNKMLKNVKK
jgi:hypothetical protein